MTVRWEQRIAAALVSPKRQRKTGCCSASTAAASQRLDPHPPQTVRPSRERDRSTSAEHRLHPAARRRRLLAHAGGGAHGLPVAHQPGGSTPGTWRSPPTPPARWSPPRGRSGARDEPAPARSDAADVAMGRLRGDRRADAVKPRSGGAVQPSVGARRACRLLLRGCGRPERQWRPCRRVGDEDVLCQPPVA